MHETTVRFTDELWARVRAASQREGASAAQFVRDATVARIAVDAHVAALRRDVEADVQALGNRVQRMEEQMRRHGLMRGRGAR
jgi:predicted DNA-binding protein